MKENTVEEMKQILIDYAIKNDLCFSFEVMKQHADVLYKAGCRLISKDDIVITKGAYESLSSKAKANVEKAIKLRKQIATNIYKRIIEMSENPCNSREEIYK